MQLFINNFMNYLTNYYKNLCEQLQEKINILEAQIRSPEQIENIGKERYAAAIWLKKASLGRELSPEEYEDLAQKELRPYIIRARKRENLLDRAAGQMKDVAASGDVKTAEQFGDVMADVNRPIYTGKVAGHANLDPESIERRLKSEEELRRAQQSNRAKGIPTTVRADTAAMRKVVAMGTDRYEPPYPQPQGPVDGMHVTPSHY
jgi:hypothetical protein